MKRTLAIALSSIALAAATSVSAQTITKGPQPSFIDYPLVEANVPARAGAERNANRAVPQPSFLDYVAVEADERAVRNTATVLAEQGLPKPSFAN
jgi:hypothetical protein